MDIMNLPTKIVLTAIAVLAVVAFTQIDFSATKKQQKEETKEQPKTMGEVVSHTSNLSTFIAAMKTADLAEKLNDTKPYTLFVPNDEAFAALPENMFTSLMEPANKDRLKELLLNHIVDGKMEASDFKDGETLSTLGGQNMTISLGDDGVMVNDAEIVRSDIPASNGVIHVIDQVVRPAAAEPAHNP